MTNTGNNVAAQAGDEPMPCPECANEYLAVRTDIHKDGREFVYCDVCGCMAQKSIWNRVSPRATADVEREAIALLREVVRLDGISLVATSDNCEICTTGEFDRLTNNIRKYLATTKPGA